MLLNIFVFIVLIDCCSTIIFLTIDNLLTVFTLVTSATSPGNSQLATIYPEMKRFYPYFCCFCRVFTILFHTWVLIAFSFNSLQMELKISVAKHISVVYCLLCIYLSLHLQTIFLIIVFCISINQGPERINIKNCKCYREQLLLKQNITFSGVKCMIRIRNS